MNVSQEVKTRLIENEKKWQAKWDNAFTAKINPDKKKYFITIPYPYVTGNLHVGHGRTYTVGDFVARFKRLQGYNVLFPVAFHITGTPVLAISSKISENDEETIKLYEEYVNLYENDLEKSKEIVKTFKDPLKVVDYFSSKIINDFKSVGYSMDFSRTFTTGEPYYNKLIEWQFKSYEEKGFLKKASYPILFCPKDKNAVGEDDIKGGDEEKVEVQEWISYKFQINYEGQKTFILTSTLRPETIYGVTNIFINPEKDYALCDSKQGKIIIGKEAVEKLNYRGFEITVLKELKGSELVGMKAIPPVTKFYNEIEILAGDFVNTSNATGIVHSVPAHSPADFMALKRIGKELKQIKVINSTTLNSENPSQQICETVKATPEDKESINKAVKEIYKIEFYEGILNENCGQFSGKKVSEVKKELSEYFIEKGNAVKIYEPTVKAKCRCGTQVIVAILENQWFLDFNHNKPLVKECLDGIKIIPDVYIKQFNDILDWLDKRPCARKRGLGTKLPQDTNWIIESLSDSTLYMTLYTIIDIIRSKNIPPEQLNKEFFDYIFTGKNNESLLVDKTTCDEARNAFEYWYPLDQRHTGIGHISNHLIFFVFAHAVLMEKKYWPEKITLNELVISEGSKMSKSKGNVVPILKLTENHSVDVYRLYCLNSADLNGKMDYREKDITELYYSIQRFENLITELNSTEETSEEISMTCKNVLSQFYKNFENGLKASEKMKLREYVQRIFYSNLNLLESNSKRLNASDKNLIKKEILLTWLKLLNPIIPHLTEEYNEQLKLTPGLICFTELPEVKTEVINEELESLENVFQRTLNDSKNLIQMLKKKGKQVNTLKIICSEQNETGYFKENNEFIDEVLEVKSTIELKSESASEKAIKSMKGKPALEVN